MRHSESKKTIWPLRMVSKTEMLLSIFGQWFNGISDPIIRLELGCLLLQCAVGQLKYSRKSDTSSDAKVVFHFSGNWQRGTNDRSIFWCVCARAVVWRVCVKRMHFKVNVRQDTSFAVSPLLIHQHETCFCNFHANRMVFFVASCFRVRFGALCLRLASLKGIHFDGSSFLFLSYAMNNSVPVQCASAIKHPL